MLIIGAGPAGLAAARTFAAAGAQVRLIEARTRPGGRAHTVMLAGQPVDLGARWFELPHARRPRRIMAALTDGHRGQTGDVTLHGADSRSSRNSFWSHWRGIEELLADAREDQPDVSVAHMLDGYWRGRDGAWRDTLDFHLALECGAPLASVSARDYEGHEDTEYSFIRGGLGTLLTRQAAGLDIVYGAPATRVVETGSGMIVETTSGEHKATCVVLAAPVTVLAAGGIVFDPPLPPAVAVALGAFLPAAYERAVIHWPGSPLQSDGADGLQIFRGDRVDNAEMLSSLGGGDLHYVELGGNLARRWQGAADPVAWRRDFTARFLKERFGPAAAGAEIVHLTDWARDPFARGSWALCPPGMAAARQLLDDFAHPRLQFATEATSRAYWGTVTGAWLEGVRVASAMLAAGLSSKSAV